MWMWMNARHLLFWLVVIDSQLYIRLAIAVEVKCAEWNCYSVELDLAGKFCSLSISSRTWGSLLVENSGTILLSLWSMNTLLLFILLSLSPNPPPRNLKSSWTAWYQEPTRQRPTYFLLMWRAGLSTFSNIYSIIANFRQQCYLAKLVMMVNDGANHFHLVNIVSLAVLLSYIVKFKFSKGSFRQHELWPLSEMEFCEVSEWGGLGNSFRSQEWFAWWVL